MSGSGATWARPAALALGPRGLSGAPWDRLRLHVRGKTHGREVTRSTSDAVNTARL